MTTYPANFEADRQAGGYVVTFPDFRYGATQGETLKEASEMAQDLLACLLSDLIKAGKELPEPTKRRGRKYRSVSLPVLQSTKVALYQAFRASGMRKSEFADRMGIPKSNLDRLFDLHHQSWFDQLEAAFAVLSKHVWVEVRDAA